MSSRARFILPAYGVAVLTLVAYALLNNYAPREISIMGDDDTARVSAVPERVTKFSRDGKTMTVGSISEAVKILTSGSVFSTGYGNHPIINVNGTINCTIDKVLGGPICVQDLNAIANGKK
jgi:hypothetical protein